MSFSSTKFAKKKKKKKKNLPEANVSTTKVFIRYKTGI